MSNENLPPVRRSPRLWSLAVIAAALVAATAWYLLADTTQSSVGPEPVAAGSGGGGPYPEARDALTALGYRLEEAEKALNDVPPQDSVEKYIKEALRRIGSRR